MTEEGNKFSLNDGEDYDISSSGFNLLYLIYHSTHDDAYFPSITTSGQIYLVGKRESREMDDNRRILEE